MTQLRKMMLDELERRIYSESTKRAYIATIKDLARYFQRRPDQLEPAHILQYQAYLLRNRKPSPNTVNPRAGALRFFFPSPFSGRVEPLPLRFHGPVTRTLALHTAIRRAWRSR